MARQLKWQVPPDCTPHGVEPGPDEPAARPRASVPAGRRSGDRCQSSNQRRAGIAVFARCVFRDISPDDRPVMILFGYEAKEKSMPWAEITHAHLEGRSLRYPASVTPCRKAKSKQLRNFESDSHRIWEKRAGVVPDRNAEIKGRYLSAENGKV